MEKTTEDTRLVFTLKQIIPIFIFLILTTNTVSIFIMNQKDNTEKISYNDEASKRRIGHAVKEMEYKLEITKLKEKLEDCNKKLPK